SYNITLRTDVKFHDGSVMTSEDVVATYNKIIFPPTGVLSPRAGAYAAVESISAPAKDKVQFKLKYPSASFGTNLASPWNFIYSAAKLKTDIHWYEKNVDGTGPFTYVSNTKGQDWVGKKNPDYFAKDKSGVQLPYLDGYKAIIITDAKANKDKAKQLLADAGVPNLTFKFLNRNITTPYEPVAVFVLDQWKQVGINATHDVKETSAYQADLRAGNFDVALDFNCDFLDEPDLQLAKFWSASGLGKGLNFAYYDDADLDKKIDAQSRETDPAKRLAVVADIDKYAM